MLPDLVCVPRSSQSEGKRSRSSLVARDSVNAGPLLEGVSMTRGCAREDTHKRAHTRTLNKPVPRSILFLFSKVCYRFG